MSTTSTTAVAVKKSALSISFKNTYPDELKKTTKKKEEKLKVVYRDSMQKMNFRDWSALKVRLKFLRDNWVVDLENIDDIFPVYSWRHPNDSLLSPEAVERLKNKYRSIIQAIDLLLSFQSGLGGCGIHSGYHVPGSSYICDRLFSEFQDCDLINLPGVVAKTPEEAEILKKAQRDYFNSLLTKKLAARHAKWDDGD